MSAYSEVKVVHTNGHGNWVHNQFGFKFEHRHGVAYSMPLPGTEEVKHISGASVQSDYRRLGLGLKYHGERLEFFKEEGCTKALTCIVNANNVAEIKILETHGWERLKTFKGLENQDLLLYFKEL